MLKNKIVILGIVILVLAGAGYAGYWYWNFQKVEDVKFTITKGGSSEILMDIIKAEQLDKKNRINIIIELVPSPPELERRFAAREELVIGAIGVASVANENLKGGNSRIIGPYFLNHNSIMVQQGSPYQSVADLRGRKIAIRKTATLYGSFAAVMKQKFNIDPETYFKMVFVSSIPEGGKFLEKGEVDAAVLAEPTPSQLLATGKFREIAKLKDSWQEMTGQPIGFTYTVAYQDWIDAHPRAAKRLVNTIIAGARLIHDRPEILGKYKDLLEIKTDEELRLVKERLPGIYSGAWDEATVKNVELELQTYVDLGLVSEKPKENIIIRLE